MLLREPAHLQTSREVSAVLENNWRAVNEMLEYVLRTSDNKAQVELTLSNSFMLANVVGTVGLGGGVAEIVKKLCSWEIPESSSEFTYKHFLILRIILRIAQSLHKLLSKKAWLHIFQVLKNLDHSINGAKEVEEKHLLSYLNDLAKKVFDNFAKYLPKDRVREEFKNSPKEINTFNTVNEVLLQFLGTSFVVNEEESPAIKSPAVFDDDDRATHVQEIRSIRIKGSITLGLKGRDVNSLVHPRKSADLSKLAKKQFPSKEEELKANLESLFVFSLFFDVRI